MTTSVEIPGGYAILRDADELRGRDRNLIKAAAMAAAAAIAKMPPDATEGKRKGETEAEAIERQGVAMEGIDLSVAEVESLIDLRKAGMVARLVSWTLDLPLPTFQTIDELPADLYDGLEAAISDAPIDDAGETDFSEKLLENGQFDKESPTGGSTSSVAPSPQENLSSPSTPALPSDGESTPTENFTQA